MHLSTPRVLAASAQVSVIVVGGTVQEVLASQPDLSVRVYDFDSIDSHDGIDYESEYKALTPFTVNELAIGDGQPDLPELQATGASLLERAEQFISGFEDDETQQGVSALLQELRIAVLHEKAKRRVAGQDRGEAATS